MKATEQDILLWESFCKGDREAFARLFRMYYGPMFLFGLKFIADRSRLEDAIHELFIELWQSRSRADVVSVKAYLLKSLKYKLLKWRRSNGRPHLIEEWSAFEWSHENFLIEQQEDEEKKLLVLAILVQLSGRQKEIIYLKFYQNLTYAEISEIMNINYQVARNLLCQAIKAMKKLLSEMPHAHFPVGRGIQIRG